MKHALVALLSLPVFYQLDYRERLGVEFDVPGLAGLEITKSFEVRYRPQSKEQESKSAEKVLTQEVLSQQQK